MEFEQLLIRAFDEKSVEFHGSLTRQQAHHFRHDDLFSGDLVAYFSTFSEFQPGDVIVTGTPGGVGFKRNPPLFMRDGDVVTVEISSVGRLTNRVRKDT